MALGLGSVQQAQALDNDPEIRRLCVPSNDSPALPCGVNPVPDQAAFKELSREMGMAFAPKLLAPAETLGVNGFQFSMQYSITNVNEEEEYWQRGVKDQSPSSTLMVSQFEVRKGLPFSAEIGANASYMIETELWAFGGMLKWALNEAVDAFPVDISLRGSLNRVVGSSELQLTTVGLDVILSRSFGAGGIANVAPYMAYSPAWILARSGVVDSTPGDASDLGRSFVFEKETLTIHRFILGSRFVFGAVNFSPEVALAKGLQSYNLNLGLDF